MQHIKEAFEQLMAKNPGAEGEFFASSATKSFTRIKVDGKKVIEEESEPIEEMESEFYES